MAATKIPSEVVGSECFRVAQRLARCWVHGSKRMPVHGEDQEDPIVGGIHPRFEDHPWVREALSKGWDRELRSHMVRIATKHLLGGGDLKTLSVIDVMPDAEYVEHARDQARRAADAKEFQERMVAKYGSMDTFLARANGRTATTFKKITPDRAFFESRGWAVPDRSTYLRKGGAA